MAPGQPARFFAHTKPGRPLEEWEPLEEHLANVARLAGEFAAALGAKDWGYLAGLWHDLGKYRDSFQRYLRSAGGASEDSGCEETAPGKVDHSTVGAIHSIRQLGPRARILAYLIAGHHAGLPDALGDGSSLNQRLENQALLADWQGSAIPSHVLEQQMPPSAPPSRAPDEVHLWLRLLFSCLTDADFLATEAFMDPERALGRKRPDPTIETLAERLAAHMQTEFGPPRTEVARLRREVLNACVAAAAQPPGLFTLTVPTGGGKTLSSMAFALNHATVWRKRRIIYVIPYTSIIEQTAGVFLRIFGDCVVEHHSNVDSDDPARDSLARRLAAENWDARIIVTTNVQFFESLFAARTSRCRKLHNIVNSVVVLDEAQLLPPEFLDPIRQAIVALKNQYGVTFVISTATQPALGFDDARELAPNPLELDRQLRRVRFEWPKSEERRTWESLAVELEGLAQVLCVVNKRDDARDLYGLIRGCDGATHLSALMCGAHRSERIAWIKERLRIGRPVRLVSTQLVEAGVDLDFPVVYRAFAGLDSIAQAAGRCNREGKLPGLGRVIVFHAPSPPPPGLLRKAVSKAREVLHGRQEEHIDPALFSSYFDLLYRQGVNSLDEKGILSLLGRDAASLQIQFRTAAERFRLVDDSGYWPVVVDWGDGRILIEELKRHGPERPRMRRLQRYLVSVPNPQIQKLRAKGDVEELLPGLFGVVTAGLYSAEVGLCTEGHEYEPRGLIC